MTLEIDPQRVRDVADGLESDRRLLDAVRGELASILLSAGDVETAAAFAAVDAVAEGLDLTVGLLRRTIERSELADERLVSEPISFAGGSVLCSAIQVASPVPSRPSTSGVTGAIDTGGIAADAGSLVRSAANPVGVAGRSAPLASIVAMAADAVLCRLKVGSGAGISTRTTVNDRGEVVYEGSRSRHRYLTATGEVLDPDPVRRDRQMWRIEHSNPNGFLTEPYPGYPAYDVNAP